MEIYLANFAFFNEIKANNPFPPIKIGDVDTAKRNIPAAPKYGLLSEAHIKIAAYKNPCLISAC